MATFILRENIWNIPRTKRSIILGIYPEYFQSFIHICRILGAKKMAIPGICCTEWGITSQFSAAPSLVQSIPVIIIQINLFLIFF